MIVCIYPCYFWLCLLFVDVWAFLWLWWAGTPLQSLAQPLVAVAPLLWRTAPGHAGLTSCSMQVSSCDSWAPEHRLIAVVHGLCCSAACGVFPDQGLNPYLLPWQVDSSPRSPQGPREMSFTHRFIHFFSQVQVLEQWLCCRHFWMWDRAFSALRKNESFLYKWPNKTPVILIQNHQINFYTSPSPPTKQHNCSSLKPLLIRFETFPSVFLQCL